MNSFVGPRQSYDNGAVITQLMRKKIEFPQPKLVDVGTLASTDNDAHLLSPIDASNYTMLCDSCPPYQNPASTGDSPTKTYLPRRLISAL